MARALYGDADIYLFDDPISAVDSRVAKKIFENCIKLLGTVKIVLLVSHQIGYIEMCDQVLVIENGSILAHGTPPEVKKYLMELNVTEEESET